MFWYNGDLITTNVIELAVDDPGLLYGATVFTTLRVYCQSLDRPLTNWKRHCDRLRSSIQFLDWQEPNWQKVRQGAEILLQDFPVLRVTIFPDGREWITGRSLPGDLTEKQRHGVAASLIFGEEFHRFLPTHKTGNYLGAWLAKTKAQHITASEAILVDANGNWLETSTGNLWGWQDGNWWTPPLEAEILPGVMRSQLIDWLKNQNQQVIEQPWTPDVVAKMEAIAYSNSIVEVIPIHTIFEERGVRSEERGQEKIHQLNYNPHHPALTNLQKLFQHE
ncbi:aminotransferase class IV [Chroococcidiopsis sp. CCNUC1]|uniref:aminotransferase class IV n=1 Tax=Chroococcidiopsis sp. CCNUC1 TaxID=2653189 RepID=UPI0035323790